MKHLIAATLMTGLAGLASGYNLPQAEPYFRAVSPIFGYDPVYGLLIGGAWFSYPTGEVADAKTTQDLNFITSLKANGAVNYAQQNPNAWQKLGYRFHIGGNNFYDFTTLKNSNEIDEQFSNVNLMGSFNLSYQVSERLETSAGVNINWFNHERDGRAWDSFFSGSLSYDERDNAINSQQGFYLRQTINYQNPIFSERWQKQGSQLIFDGRFFHNTGNQQVFALRTLAEKSFGQGFTSSPGGSELLRGYLPGQYESDAMLAVQTEYRFPIWTFIRGVAFGESAQLFNDQQDTLASAGLGLRFGLPPDQSISVRWDNAVNLDGQWLSYVNFNQVF